MWCKQWDLFAGALVASDGRSFKAVNAKKRHCTPDKRATLLQQIDQRVEGYLQELDGEDPQDEAGTPGGAVADMTGQDRSLQQTQALLHRFAGPAGGRARRNARTAPERRAISSGRGAHQGLPQRATRWTATQVLLAYAVTNDPASGTGSVRWRGKPKTSWAARSRPWRTSATITASKLRPVSKPAHQRCPADHLGHAKPGLFSQDDFRYGEATNTDHVRERGRTCRFDAVEPGRPIRDQDVSLPRLCAQAAADAQSRGAADHPVGR